MVNHTQHTGECAVKFSTGQALKSKNDLEGSHYVNSIRPECQVRIVYETVRNGDFVRWDGGHERKPCDKT